MPEYSFSCFTCNLSQNVLFVKQNNSVVEPEVLLGYSVITPGDSYLVKHEYESEFNLLASRIIINFSSSNSLSNNLDILIK